MAKRTDEHGTLSELRLCEIVGVTQQQRQALVRRGLLDPAPSDGCRQIDAIELATLECVGRYLSPSEQVVAWNELRSQLGSIVPKGRLDVVFDRELGAARLVRDDQALRSAVISGRPVRVIELAPRLQEVLDAFRRWSGVSTTPPVTNSASRRSSRAG